MAKSKQKDQIEAEKTHLGIFFGLIQLEASSWSRSSISSSEGFLSFLSPRIVVALAFQLDNVKCHDGMIECILVKRLKTKTSKKQT